MRFCLGVLVLLVLVAPASAESEHVIEIDFDRTNGFFRPLHSINRGGDALGGTVSLAGQLRELKVPFTRLHDCEWPFPDVVDIHAIFRQPHADPAKAESYDFALTDEYLASVAAAGMKIVYRLGESIEHTLTKRFVKPPPDPAHWAEICVGIIRHYTRGWANGHRYDIPYWEIWNEPENRPAMWTGSDEDYFRLYSVAARRIKREFPKLKIGGPSVGHSGAFVGDRFEPSAFVTNFLALCRRDELPIDFFSWHCYTPNLTELVSRVRAIRQLLDEYGFQKTESHLNEWNYLPDGSWKAINKSTAPMEREAFYTRMCGDEGATFILSALLELQDSPVDMCNLFHGDVGAFGIFNQYGVAQRNYHALKAFSAIVNQPRAIVRGSVPGQLAVGASGSLIVISNFKLPGSKLRVRTRGVTANAYEVQINFGKTFQVQGNGEIQFELKSPGMALIRLN